MNSQWKWRALPAVVVAFLVMGVTMIGIGAASTPAADRHVSPHHTNTTSINTRAASPADGMGTMGGMMLGIPAAMGMPGTPVAGATMSQDFDLLFIDMMIPHHESAVAMAQVALTRGEHQEIRDLAQNVIDSQSAEITQMQAWRDAWYPDAPVMPIAQMTRMMDEMMPGAQMSGGMGAHGSGMGGMHAGSDMSMMDPKAAAQSLSATTGPFDQAFIEMMIPHHQGAAAMAEAALQHAIHPEIKQLAQAIIDAQEQEIAQMNGWLADWYGGAPEASPSGSQRSEEVTVTLSEFALHASRTDFQAGQTYRFVVTNDGVIDHEFMIMPHMADTGQMDMEALDAMALVMIPASELTPGSTRTVEVTFPSTVPDGGYELVCAVPGHYSAGMMLPISVSA